MQSEQFKSFLAKLQALEWLGDRSNLLGEIETVLKDAKRDGDVDDVIGEMVGTLEQAEAILEASGWPGGGDFLEALQVLADRADRAPKLEYDL